MDYIVFQKRILCLSNSLTKQILDLLYTIILGKVMYNHEKDFCRCSLIYTELLLSGKSMSFFVHNTLESASI